MAAAQQAPIHTAAGTRLPRLLYGTAWKKEATADLVYAALRAGFRAIDTAAQPRHYREDLVAAGVRRALADGVVTRRADLYIQTKFTSLGGQDVDGPLPLPYNPTAPLAEQVRQSVESSLRNFAVGQPDGQPDNNEQQPYLDCVLLHSPLPSREATREAWRALRAFVPARVRSLGVSNASLADLQVLVEVASEVAEEGEEKDEIYEIYETEENKENKEETRSTATAATILPVVVQNRFHRGQAGHDVALRRFCGTAAFPIVYQSFWTLTANRDLLYKYPHACGISAVASGASVSPEVALYALITLGIGGGVSDAPDLPAPLCPIVILDGTKSSDHMDADLAGLARVEAWATQRGSESTAAWHAAVAAFRRVINEK